MQQRLRAAGLAHEPLPSRRIGEERREPLAEPIPDRCRLRRQREVRARQRLKPADGVADVRPEKVHAAIRAVLADLEEQRMPAGPHVQLGDELDGGLEP